MPISPSWRLPFAIVFLAFVGNMVHIALGALSTIGGPSEYARQILRYFSWECLECFITFFAMIHIGWFGFPFYLLGFIALIAERDSAKVRGILAIIVLIALDVGAFFASDSKDWYVTLAPIFLGVLAAVAGAILYFEGLSGSTGTSSDSDGDSKAEIESSSMKQRPPIID